MILSVIAMSLLIIGFSLWAFVLPLASQDGLMEYLEGEYRTTTSNVVVISGLVSFIAGFICLAFALTVL